MPQNFRWDFYLDNNANTYRVDWLSGATSWGINDTYVLWGQGGNDILIGRNYFDPSNPNFGQDWLVGGANDDTLWGLAGNDRLWGDDGNDILYGGNNNDYLIGGANNDRLWGDGGSDNLWGGTGRDVLYGGPDADSFHFAHGDSGRTTATADVIVDWDQDADYINMPIAGTPNNFREFAFDVTSVEQAAATADQISWGYQLASGQTLDHIFLFNLATNTGYLCSDTGGDASLDSVVVLQASGSGEDLDWFDII